MGTASSVIAHEHPDEEYADEEDEFGVITNVPVEFPPQRKPTSSLNLIRSVGSFGKKKTSSSRVNVITKSTSLRSAHSLEIESEVDKLKKEIEATQSEVKELQEAKQKVLNENRRLRSELKIVQSTCTKLMHDREFVLEAKEQALQRALAFEKGKHFIHLSDPSIGMFQTLI